MGNYPIFLFFILFLEVSKRANLLSLPYSIILTPFIKLICISSLFFNNLINI